MSYLLRLTRRKNTCSQPASASASAVAVAVALVALLARPLRLTPAAAVRSFQMLHCARIATFKQHLRNSQLTMFQLNVVGGHREPVVVALLTVWFLFCLFYVCVVLSVRLLLCLSIDHRWLSAGSSGYSTPNARRSPARGGSSDEEHRSPSTSAAQQQPGGERSAGAGAMRRASVVTAGITRKQRSKKLADKMYAAAHKQLTHKQLTHKQSRVQLEDFALLWPRAVCVCDILQLTVYDMVSFSCE
eukprot:COSAG06_NODE_1087_length_10749_cov_1130.191174_9_plen_245_part_00